MAANGESKEILSGIRLIIEELREERQEQRKRDAAWREEQRKRDEDWREEQLKRDEAWRGELLPILKRFDEREGELHRALIIIGNVGKRILQTQEKHTKLLEKILGALTARGNGKHRTNGH